MVVWSKRANVLETSYHFAGSTYGPIYRPFWDNRELSHQCWWGDNCSHYTWLAWMFNFKSCPLDTHRNPILWFILNHICTLRVPSVFQYIKGRTLKIDLFQFLCMSSSTRYLMLVFKSCPLNFKERTKILNVIYHTKQQAYANRE